MEIAQQNEEVVAAAATTRPWTSAHFEWSPEINKTSQEKGGYEKVQCMTACL